MEEVVIFLNFWDQIKKYLYLIILMKGRRLLTGFTYVYIHIWHMCAYFYLFFILAFLIFFQSDRCSIILSTYNLFFLLLLCKNNP